MEIGLTSIAQIIDSLKEDLVPWRRTNARKRAELTCREARAEIRQKKAVAAELNARAAKSIAEAKKLEAEAQMIKAEARHRELANEKLTWEIEETKLRLAIELATRLKPTMPESDRVLYALNTLRSVGISVTSRVELNRSQKSGVHDATDASGE